MLRRSNVDRHFNLKTDYYSRGYGVALYPKDSSDESIKAEQAEKEGEKCLFDNQMTGLKLYPVLFESKALTGPAFPDHSHPGEATAGDFTTMKFRHFFWGKPFT